MAKLQAERAHFIGKSEFLGPRPYTADAVGRDARLDQLDSLVEPFARSPVDVVLDRRRAAHVEGAATAGAIAHERRRNSQGPPWHARAGSGAGGGNRPVPRSRPPWCPAPAGRGPN